MTASPADPRFFAGRGPAGGSAAASPGVRVAAEESAGGAPALAAGGGPVADQASDATGDAGPGPTGHLEIDRALAGLTRPSAAPLADQVARYGDAHEVLRRTLAEIDQA